ncbi:MAG: class I SAM-dependent methyltransferase [Patescibacteria group bacterium]
MKEASYSTVIPKILEEKGRSRISAQIKRTLQKYVRDRKEAVCLDVGCSSGKITYELSGLFKRTVGIDLDKEALKIARKRFKRKNLEFKLINAENISFNDCTFEVVILNQVYEFVDNPKKLVAEVYRVLKPGGICFVGARNKLSLIEGQTGIPLIHFLSHEFVVKLLKYFGKSYYPPKYLNYRELKNLFKQFKIFDLTPYIVKYPQMYGYKSLVKYSFITKLFPIWIFKMLVFLFPNFIFICRKKS